MIYELISDQTKKVKKGHNRRVIGQYKEKMKRQISGASANLAVDAALTEYYRDINCFGLTFYVIH